MGGAGASGLIFYVCVYVCNGMRCDKFLCLYFAVFLSLIYSISVMVIKNVLLHGVGSRVNVFGWLCFRFYRFSSGGKCYIFHTDARLLANLSNWLCVCDIV